MKATVVEVNGDSVVLKKVKGGDVITVPLARLSAQDVEFAQYARQALTEAPAEAHGKKAANRSGE
ncbi:MAG: hypothetical protein U0935_19225 [Pirellulales bacterium]